MNKEYRSFIVNVCMYCGFAGQLWEVEKIVSGSVSVGVCVQMQRERQTVCVSM